MISKKMYASMVINGSEGWGDGFPSLWLAEYLYYKKGIYSIELYGGGNGETASTLSLKIKYRLRKLINFKLYDAERDAFNSNKTEDYPFDRDTIFAKEAVKKNIFHKVFRLLNIKPFHHNDYIEKPKYISKWLFEPPVPSDYDEILVTHYNHSSTGLGWASPPLRDAKSSGLLPPLSMWIPSSDLPNLTRFDLNAGVLKLLLLEGFIPSMPILKPHVIEELSAFPARYVCIQGRSEDSGTVVPSRSRNYHSGDEYYEWIVDFVAKCWNKYKVPIVFTSNYIAIEGIPTVDATNLSLWAKIELNRRAIFSYVMHSGFGMIVAVYRGLKNTKLINASKPALCRNPPALIFPNVWMTTDVVEFTASPPGWVDGHDQWQIDFKDSLIP